MKQILYLLLILFIACAASCCKCESPCRVYVCTTVHLTNGRGTLKTDTTDCQTQGQIDYYCARNYINNDTIFHQINCK